MPVDRMTADAEILRALAHPLRRSLLDELDARGTATATTLAAAVGRPVNAVSFHLRELARYGLIEEAEGGRDGRQRWWQPASTGGVQVTDDALRGTEEGQAWLEAFQQSEMSRVVRILEGFFARRDPDAPDPGWGGGDDITMRLTPDEAQQYAADVRAVMAKWRAHGRQADADPDDSGADDADDAETGASTRRTYLGLSLVTPHSPTR